MSRPLGYREVLALTLQQLGKHPAGQYATLTDEVITAAKGKGLLPTSHSAGGIRYVNSGRSGDEERVSELVREAMWECLIKRLIVFGMNGSNSNWPFYRVTEYGASAVKSTTSQPYDPDGFMAHFDATCTGIEPPVRAYVAEAVLAFNSGCTRSSAVMLGCASEKLLLLLCDAFESAISDSAKKAKFTKDLNAKWAISHKYATVRDRLDLMVTAKKLPHEHAETVSSELPAGFELLRRCHNAAGHPDVPGSVDPDTVFMNLRMFTEYARRVHAMIGHFGAAPADW
jgi:hypothetical protein